MKESIKDLLVNELHDMLSSAEQIVHVLPEMATAAESPELKNTFTSHLQETKEQIRKLKKIFTILKVGRKEKFCKATKGLIEEWKDVLKEYKGKSAIRDAALISKAQRIEHYEISAYGTAHAFAKEIDEDEVANLLQEILNVDGNANKKLTKVAIGGMLSYGINHEANKPEKNIIPTLHKPKKKTNTRAKKDLLPIGIRVPVKKSTANKTIVHKRNAAPKKTLASKH